MVSPPSHAMEGWLERLSEQTGWLKHLSILIIIKKNNKHVNLQNRRITQ